MTAARTKRRRSFAQAARQDSRLRYLRQENAKIPAALNTGFRAAQGEFLTWTSDDNAYEPNAIELMARYLREHPEVGLVYCDCQIVNSQGRGCSDVAAEAAVPDRDRRTVSARVLCTGAVWRKWSGSTIARHFWRKTMIIGCASARSRLWPTWPGIAPYRFRVHERSLSSLRGAEAELQAARVRARYARSRRERQALMAAGYCAAAAELRWIGRYRRGAATQRQGDSACCCRAVHLWKHAADMRVDAASRGREGERAIREREAGCSR